MVLIKRHIFRPLKTTVVLNYIKTRLLRKEHRPVSNTRTNQLILFGEIIGTDCDSHIQHTNLSGNTIFVIAKCGGTPSNHSTLSLG
jgi:hypothetical protein